MRILYVTDALAIWGGLERVLVEKANYFAVHDGYEVFMLTICQGGHPFPFPLDNKVTHVDLNIPFYSQYQYSGIYRLLSLRRLHHDCRSALRQQLNHLNPDVIVCPRIDFVKDICNVKGDIPLVFESHSSFWTSRFEGAGLLRRLHTWWMNQSAKRAQAVVTLTEGDAAEWRKLTPRVCVIPNVVHLNDSGLYSDCTAKSAIFVGRFSKQKDVGSLLRIWTLVRERYPDWSLHIYAGYGEDQDSVLAEIKQMDAHVQVHEATSNMMEKYRESSILLMTSSYEPFGLVLPEAMSCGLPVVAFDCPYGPADIITDGTDGFLVKERSYDDFSNKVCQLMDHLDLRLRMGKSGIESSKKYAESCIMPLWKQLFDRLVQQ